MDVAQRIAAIIPWPTYESVCVVAGEGKDKDKRKPDKYISTKGIKDNKTHKNKSRILLTLQSYILTFQNHQNK
jgi:hypothetical protein